MATKKEKFYVSEERAVSEAKELGKNIETTISNAYLYEYDTYLINPRVAAGSVGVIYSSKKMADFSQILLNMTEWDIPADKTLSWIKGALTEKIHTSEEFIRILESKAQLHGVDIAHG